MDERHIERLVDAIITQALRDRASDIHFEPQADDLLIRFRIDGLLRNIQNLPENLKGPVLSRVKIMSELDISEKRVPQDGRTTISINYNGKQIDVDLRVSTLPVIYGEKIVIRLLPKDKSQISLEQLGLNTRCINLYSKFLEKAHGLILITGPTGSGKTSTLYSSLLKVKDPTLNIVTIEDPIEYQLEGINQVHVHPRAGLTFAGGLRSILRQDPDIIMVGEVRDQETASIVFQSALTGHLVFSTLHTNDTVSTITRLIDMGVEPYLISSAIIGIVAQRLMRMICPECRMEYSPSPKERELLELEQTREIKLYKGKGCDLCYDTGYWERDGIFEILPVTEEFKALINLKAPEQQLRELAIQQGLITLKKAAIEKVLQGTTTVEELLRVVML